MDLHRLPLRISPLLASLAAWGLLGCGGSEETSWTPSFFFDLSVTLPTDQDPLGVDGDEGKVEEMRLIVFYADGTEASFPLSQEGDATFPAEEVGPGNDVTLRLEGLVDGNVVFSGEATGISLEDGGSARIYFAREGSVGRLATVLAEPRAFAATSSLPDGRVVLAGGTTYSDENEEALTDSLLVVDPADPSAEKSGMVPGGVDLVGGTMVAVQSFDAEWDGDLLFLGGAQTVYHPAQDPPMNSTGDYVETSTEVYLLDAETAGQGMESIGTMDPSRVQGLALALPEERVVVTGGYFVEDEFAYFDATVPLFTVSSGESATAGAVSGSRRGHAATFLEDGRILLAGGYGYWDDGGIGGGEDESKLIAEMEVWDPSDGYDNEVVTELTEPRVLLSATLLPDGTVLLAGGSTVFSGTFGSIGDMDDPLKIAEIYDPVGDDIQKVDGGMNASRAEHAAVALKSGDVLMCGGWSTTNDGESSCEVYRFAEGTFQEVPDDPEYEHDTDDLGSGRAGLSAVSLSGGDVLLMGGWNDGRPRDDIFRYHCTRAESLAPQATLAPTRPAPAFSPSRTGTVSVRFGK